MEWLVYFPPIPFAIIKQVFWAWEHGDCIWFGTEDDKKMSEIFCCHDLTMVTFEFDLLVSDWINDGMMSLLLFQRCFGPSENVMVLFGLAYCIPQTINNTPPIIPFAILSARSRKVLRWKCWGCVKSWWSYPRLPY